MSEPDIDYRFSLANERTYLAWMRTALAFIVGGVAAAKALTFHHEVLRWVVAAPPFPGGALIAWEGRRRWRDYTQAMARDARLPFDRTLSGMTLAFIVYAAVALAAIAVDG